MARPWRGECKRHGAVPLTETPIRILLDHRPALFGRGGIATYTRELVAAYAAAHPADHLALWGHRYRRALPRPDAATPPGAHLHAGRIPSRALTVLARFGRGADGFVGGADVVHWTDYVDLPAGRVPVVATVHDLLFEDLPECYTPDMRRGLAAHIRRVVRHARRLLVPSARTRDALIVRHGVSPGRIDVVAHGVGRLPSSAPCREHGPYVLAVGTLEPRKNLARLLAAHDALWRGGETLRLVVAGARGWLDDDLVRTLDAQDGVIWEGAVSPERLGALYRGALALAYPSLGEGFGLPVLEAMAAGLPVLVGRDTACADLAGAAGLTVDPRDTDALAEGLTKVAFAESWREAAIEEGRRRAATFTWQAAARATRVAYAEAVRA